MNSGAQLDWLKLSHGEFDTTIELIPESSNPGPYDVTKFNIGYPSVREVSRSSPLIDGERDNTKLHGSRVVTIQINIYGDANNSPNRLFENLKLLMHPVNRYFISYKLNQVNRARRILVRPESLSQEYSIQTPSLIPVDLIFKGFTGRVESAEISEVTIKPSGAASGREYDLIYDREYPNGGPISGAIINNTGTARAPVVIQLYGPMIAPGIYNDDLELAYVFNDGFSILEGDFVEINSENRTVRLNGNENQSLLHELDYSQSNWWPLGLKRNQIRLVATGTNNVSQARISWRPNYI